MATVSQIQDRAILELKNKVRGRGAAGAHSEGWLIV